MRSSRTFTNTEQNLFYKKLSGRYRVVALLILMLGTAVFFLSGRSFSTPGDKDFGLMDIGTFPLFCILLSVFMLVWGHFKIKKLLASKLIAGKGIVRFINWGHQSNKNFDSVVFELKKPSGEEGIGFIRTYELSRNTAIDSEIDLWFDSGEKIFVPDNSFARKFDPGSVTKISPDKFMNLMAMRGNKTP